MLVMLPSGEFKAALMWEEKAGKEKKTLWVKSNPASIYWDVWCTFSLLCFLSTQTFMGAGKHRSPISIPQSCAGIACCFIPWPLLCFQSNNNDLCGTCRHNDALTICRFWNIMVKQSDLILSAMQSAERLRLGLRMGTGVIYSVKTHKLHILLLGHILWQPDYCWETTIAAAWPRAPVMSLSVKLHHNPAPGVGFYKCEAVGVNVVGLVNSSLDGVPQWAFDNRTCSVHAPLVKKKSWCVCDGNKNKHGPS